MPFREWAKKHIKNGTEEKGVDYTPPPSVQITRSDTTQITPLQIPDAPVKHERGSLSARPASSSKKDKRFTLLGMRHRSSSQNSLPDWNPPSESDPNAERDWEERATKLAKLRPNSLSASHEDLTKLANLSLAEEKQKAAQSADGHLLPEAEVSESIGIIRGISSEQALQEAIRLHEEGSLEKATELFREIAEQPINDENRVMGQLLYGLALRHGWGCKADMNKAVVYLKAAAEIAANAEDNALKSGLPKGGNFKGELTLAIFELGNCFRNGWGVEKDNKAARQYFETAAHLGDPEAAQEAAWFWMNGIGCKRSKKEAAKYYRLAEKAGSKIVGNSWIWKEKYDPTAKE